MGRVVAGIWMVRGRFTVWRERHMWREGRRAAQTLVTSGVSGVRGHGRDLGQTHDVGRFAAGLENVDGVVGVDVLHGNPIDHDNLVLGAAHGRKHNCEIICVGATQPTTHPSTP